MFLGYGGALRLAVRVKKIVVPRFLNLRIGKEALDLSRRHAAMCPGNRDVKADVFADVRDRRFEHERPL